MFFRKCSVCGCSMDSGEGQNGVCEDCLSGKEQERRREMEVARMIRCTDYEQMEEFLNGCKY